VAFFQNMIRTLLKSKIHRATVTDTDIHYDGSLGIDADLMKAADILPYELIQVYNINNGERFETYAITEPPASGAIILRGAAARKGLRGDLIIITAFAPFDDEECENFNPAIIYLDAYNRPKEGL
jgi:aspartate 1-decarboxylase